MASAPIIEYAGLEDLHLDADNPRLGRDVVGKKFSEDRILDLMKDWSLEELAVSFLETGFWPHEALLIVREGGKNIVVEGNRRLAALKFLKLAVDGSPVARAWTELVSAKKPAKVLFEKIPFIKVAGRKEVSAFLGFRHVTGIKEWHPAEKAEFISKLIEEQNLSYEEVRRRIGSKAPTVRQNYIAYRILVQMEDVEGISIPNVESRFSVLYLSLRNEGTQKYLDVDIQADPKAAKRPIPKSHLKNLKLFALWLFGDDDHAPIIEDSRQVDDFGRVLASEKAVQYLMRTERPSFEAALDLAGGDEPQVVEYVLQGADRLRLALQRAHLHKKSSELKKAVEEAARHALQLASLYPGLAKSLVDEQRKHA